LVTSSAVKTPRKALEVSGIRRDTPRVCAAESRCVVSTSLGVVGCSSNGRVQGKLACGLRRESFADWAASDFTPVKVCIAVGDAYGNCRST